jgi:hypothetical protein
MRTFLLTLMTTAVIAAGCDLPKPPQALRGPAPVQTAAPPSPTAPTALTDTPQAAMQRYEDAKNQGDYKTQAKYLTPETLEAFATMKISEGLSWELGGGPVPPSLAKHGISREKLREIAALPQDAQKGAVLAAAATMRDLPSFYAETMRLNARPTQPPPPATISDVNIQGDRATAHVVADINGQPFHADVQLRRYADGWKVDDSHYYKLD